MKKPTSEKENSSRALGFFGKVLVCTYKDALDQLPQGAELSKIESLAFDGASLPDRPSAKKLLSGLMGKITEEAHQTMAVGMMSQYVASPNATIGREFFEEALVEKRWWARLM